MDDFWREFFEASQSTPEGDLLANIYLWAAENPDKAILTVFALVSAPFLAWVFLRKHFFPKPVEFSDEPLSGGDRNTASEGSAISTGSGPAIVAGNGSTITVNQFTQSKYEAHLRAQLDRVTEELLAEKDESKALLTKKSELERRLADIDSSFAEARQRILELEALLEREGNQLGYVRLERAEKAMSEGDFDEADKLLAEISAEGDLAVQRKARAEFGRAQIAEEQVRWADAARHYGEAARNAPSYERLRLAVRFAWKAGDYATTLALGPQFLQVAKAEHGEKSAEYAIALSDHAIALSDSGDRESAEPLFRRAIALTRELELENRPDDAVLRNNLASLLAARGDYDEAEELYLEALTIDALTIGTRHPDYAVHLNNYASLLCDTGRPDQAVEFFEEALDIGRDTIGTHHPGFAIRLNNLAGLLRALGELEKSKEHYAEAYGVLDAVLGSEHPNTQLGGKNYASILREHFPDDPALAELEATFGPDIGT